MKLPLALQSWIDDPRERAMSYLVSKGQWEALHKWYEPQEIEFDHKVRHALQQENTSTPHWNDAEVVRRAMQALGMGLVDYLESVLGGMDGGTRPQPDSSVSAGSSQSDEDSPAA